MSKIIGNTVGLPNPRPDWNQTDETKADFIKNKPKIQELAISGANNFIYDLDSGIYIIKASNVAQIKMTKSKSFPCSNGTILIVSGRYHSGNLPTNQTYFKKGVLLIQGTSNTLGRIISGTVNVDIIDEDGTKTLSATWDGGEVEHIERKIQAITVDSTNQQYPSAKAVYNHVAEAKTQINDTLSHRANALKGNVSNNGIIDISDISPVEHNLQVSVTSGSANVVGVPVVCRGKNLFGLEGRVETTFNKVQHNFTGNSIFLAYSPSNNVESSGSFTYDRQKEEIVYNNTSNNWYGLGVDIKVDPSTYYSISQQELSDLGNIGVAFYDSDGVYIGWTNQYNLTKAFQTPGNAAWAVIALVCKTKNEQATFTKVQLEKGMVATSFEKYSPPQSRTTNSNGEVVGLKSIYPRTIIETQNPSVTINCEYNKDINKAYQKLVDAVIALGGTV